MKRPSQKDLGGYRKGVMDPHLWLSHSLSPHSVCKKSPNLLAALLPLPDLCLKKCPKPETMLEVGVALCWKGWVP